MGKLLISQLVPLPEAMPYGAHIRELAGRTWRTRETRHGTDDNTGPFASAPTLKRRPLGQKWLSYSSPTFSNLPMFSLTSVLIC